MLTQNGRKPLESEVHPEDSLPKSLRYAAHAFVLLLAAGLLGLHFVHLKADFPNHSPWMDWAKYTDEGWYGDAAIRYYQLGRWYVEGDFNPAAALPVWPLLEAFLFRLTGVSLVAVRALTVSVLAGICVASWFLMARGPVLRQRAPAAATAAVLLLAASPFCFVFTRLAILEPLLVLLTLLAMLVARMPGSNRRTIVLLGLLVPVLILTKTTAIFLLPAVAWMLFASFEYKWKPFLRVGLAACGLGVGVWLAYFLLLVRPHFLLDYRYLFSANAYTGMTRDNFIEVLSGTVRDGMWVGSVLYPAVLVAVLVVLFNTPRLREMPLIVSFLLWIGGYATFLAYHNNLQPRYYLVVAVPMTLLVPLVLEKLVLERFSARLLRVAGWGLASLLIASIVIPDTLQMIGYLRNPEYTLLEAALKVKEVVDADPTHNPLILSISGSEISLMTGLHSIDDDFGTLELPDRVKKYMPGWYVAWNQIDDDKMDALTPQFHLERVAAFPAMDDPDRNLLIVYRLDPPELTPHLKRKGKPTPSELRTKVGQQPSTTQLEH